MMRGTRLGLLLACAACATVPPDPFATGERALARGDLLAALAAFDQVAVDHARYPEARAAAAGAERCIRRSQEMLLDGLRLRAEWRDDEAMAAFQRARSVWPALPGAELWIQATQARLRLFDGQPAAPGAATGAAAVVVPGPEPAVASRVMPGAPTPVYGPPAALPTPLPESASPALSGLPPAPLAETGGDDRVPGRLAAVELLLLRGRFDEAIADLQAMHQQQPADLRVRLRLARVLHQRALLRYGQGALPSAILDWQRVLELDAGAEDSRRLLELARRERDKQGS